MQRFKPLFTENFSRIYSKLNKNLKGNFIIFHTFEHRNVMYKK
jgi:hypothetical protein